MWGRNARLKWAWTTASKRHFQGRKPLYAPPARTVRLGSADKGWQTVSPMHDPPKPNMNAFLRILHHCLLFVVTLCLLVQLASGVMLNHAQQLGLDARYPDWRWLERVYREDEFEPQAVFLVEDKIVSQLGDRLFLDAHPVTFIQRPLIGAVSLEALIVAATDDGLLLINRDGDLVDRLGGRHGLPGGIRNIGIYHGDPVLQASNGMWRSDFMLDVWEPISLQGVSWSTPFPMPEAVARELKAGLADGAISLQRLLGDLHGGRLFGKAGIWLADLLTLVLLMLAVSGLVMWYRRLR